jgi:hypothetical protein
MAIFIANENGDWWAYEPNRTMAILDTDDLPEDVAKEWGYLDEDGNPSDEGDWADEQLIWEYGKVVSQDNLLP